MSTQSNYFWDVVCIGSLILVVQLVLVAGWVSGPPPLTSPWIFYSVLSFMSLFWAIADVMAFLVWRDTRQIRSQNYRLRVETEDGVLFKEAMQEVEEFLASDRRSNEVIR